MWELNLVVTVYRREHWMRGLSRNPRPVAEQCFAQPLDDAQSGDELREAMRTISDKANDWMGRQAVSLVTYVVVTVYSLEVNCDAA